VRAVPVKSCLNNTIKSLLIALIARPAPAPAKLIEMSTSRDRDRAVSVRILTKQAASIV